MRQLNSKEVYKAYGLYQCGKSIRKIAEELGVKPMHLYKKFEAMKLKLRPKVKRIFIEWKGVRYYRDKRGYYRSYVKDGDKRKATYLHQVIYGMPVPPNFIVVFKDGNKENFSADNLVLRERKENEKAKTV